MGYTQAMRDAGVFVAGDELHPAETASTVRVPNGERVVTDGPFAETKEILGGYYLLDLPDLDAALTWAEQAPHVARGSVEVRPVVAVRVSGNAAQAVGRAFREEGPAILGHARPAGRR